MVHPLYYALVRPPLDYCIQSGAPQCEGDVDTVEQSKISRGFAGCLGGWNMGYKNRLRDLGLLSLEKRK